MENEFNLIKSDKRLLYCIIRGSTLYNLNTADSDVDYGGIYICKPNELLGLGFDYHDQVSDSRHDKTWYEIGCFLKLLLKSNPSIMEYLFVPKDKIIGEINPIMTPILENRNEFITKQLFNPLVGYSYQQIKKSKGYDKMCNWERDRIERKTPFDFCYTFKNQGSTKITNWLDDRGLKQEYCGIVNIPNMHDVYGVYYDYTKHMHDNGIKTETFSNCNDNEILKFIDFVSAKFHLSTEKDINEWYNKELETNTDGTSRFRNYQGIINNENTSTQLRLSSIPKGEKPICYMSYNQTGYTKHCIDYKNYQTWLKERNPIRFESNKNKNYDAKNISHCVRLMHMGLELAKGEGFNVVRTWDRDFILKVKNHEFEYDEIMDYIEKKYEEFKKAIETSAIKEEIDTNLINDLLIDIRKKQLNSII